MEYYYWSLFNNGSCSTTSNAVRTTNIVHPWQSTWDDNLGNHFSSLNYTAAVDSAPAVAMAGKEPKYWIPDAHLTCLKLGKRQYCDQVAAGASSSSYSSVNKKGVKAEGLVAAAAPPRCQVEGCGVALVNAKDYHRRHKVCETHAKAPKVVVLGIEQRFCQQCSRFHSVGEFDEAKRSCRRRLAGHNERRRKGSQEPRKAPHPAGKYRHPHLLDSGGCALSLLSSTTGYSNPCWNLSSAAEDLPARCSAALRELIAENRASRQQHLLGHTTIDDRYWINPSQHTTLDLMRAHNSEMGLLTTGERESSLEKENGVPIRFGSPPL